MTTSADARLTKNMRAILERLDNGAELSSRELGRVLFPTSKGGMDHREVATIGASVAGHLRRHNFVQFLSDARAWRITAAGRAALAAEGKDGQ